jgi:hypothetical protein
MMNSMAFVVLLLQRQYHGWYTIIYVTGASICRVWGVVKLQVEGWRMEKCWDIYVTGALLLINKIWLPYHSILNFPEVGQGSLEKR